MITDTDISAEIAAYLGTNPDPQIPCEANHDDPDRYPCNEDGGADWHKVDTCGCAKYVCESTRQYELHYADEGGYWWCRVCTAEWPKAEDTTTWRKIR